MSIVATARITLKDADRDLPGAFGLGCVQLLEGVAMERLGMAYSKAWRIIREAEDQLDCQLLVRDGARGSTLTPAGERAVTAYRTLQTEVNELLARRTGELLDL